MLPPPKKINFFTTEFKIAIKTSCPTRVDRIDYRYSKASLIARREITERESPRRPLRVSILLNHKTGPWKGEEDGTRERERRKCFNTLAHTYIHLYG